MVKKDHLDKVLKHRNKRIVLECQYFPPIITFGLFQAQKVVFEACETYQKRSFRNKCLIASEKGVQRLTVPLSKGKHESQPITEVSISYDEPWQARHFNTIQSAYGSSAYYDEYIGAVRSLLFKQERFLFLYNLHIIRGICKLLDFESYSCVSKEYLPGSHYDLDLRNVMTPRSYDMALPQYPQVFGDRYSFKRNLSILDLLFCMGPSAKSFVSPLT